jgi:hypothetical protein
MQFSQNCSTCNLALKEGQGFDVLQITSSSAPEMTILLALAMHCHVLKRLKWLQCGAQ